MTGEPTHTASEMAPHTPAISIIVWKVNYPLRFIVSYVQPARIKNCSKSTSAIKIATMKNTDNFRYAKGSHHVLPPNRHLSLSAKMNGTQRRTLVSPRRMHCMYCGMPKGTSRAEVTSNSEKIKPVALAVIKLHLSEASVSQLLGQ